MPKSNPTRGARLPDDLDEKFIDYKEKYNKTNSEAVRDMFRAALNDTGSEPTTADEVMLSVASNMAAFAMLLGLLGIATTLSSSVAVIGPLAAAYVGGMALLVAGILIVLVARRPVRRLVAAVRQLDADESGPPEVSDQ